MDSQNNPEVLSIALVGGTDHETQAAIEGVLGAAGIECFLEGSAVYNVQVHPEDRQRAIDILKSSNDLKGHWIQFAAEE